MTYKDLKVIDSSWIDERIVDLQAALLGVTMTDETIRYSVIDAKIKLLEAIKLQMLDVTPILKETFNAGELHNENKKDVFYTEASTFYKGFKQFLNTEIK
jgi:hypothetical protein